jgi:hypothetical protein
MSWMCGVFQVPAFRGRSRLNNVIKFQDAENFRKARSDRINVLCSLSGH